MGMLIERRVERFPLKKTHHSTFLEVCDFSINTIIYTYFYLHLLFVRKADLHSFALPEFPNTLWRYMFIYSSH